MNLVAGMRENRKLALKVLAIIFSGIEVGMSSFEIENDPKHLTGVFFMAAIICIVTASILEIREEIQVKRIEKIKYFYPMYRLGIIIFFDSIVFIFLPMAAFAFLFTVFG